ncbi:MAG: thioesterase family protein [Porticoccaceae bacterium]
MTAQWQHTVVDVSPDWIDYNGHMNLAYYVLAFDKATDDFYDKLGIGLDYRRRTNCSMFTLAINVDYLREVFAGDQLRISTLLLNSNSKRLRYIHQMYKGEGDELAATNECLAMHVDMGARRSTAFPDDVLARIVDKWSEHRLLSPPAQAGRVFDVKIQRGN